MSFSKSEYMLKYQKAKVKLLEYDVPKQDYPKFRLNYKDLAFPTILTLSQFSEAIIEEDYDTANSLKKYLRFCSEFYDAAMKSREQINHDLDFLLTGAIAYFFEDNYGSAMVLSAEANNLDLPMDMRGTMVEVFNLIFGRRKKGRANQKIIKAFEKYSKGGNSENVLRIAKENCDLAYKTNNENEAFFAETLYAVIKIAIVNSARLLLPLYSGISNIKWESYLQKYNSIKMLWPAQRLIGEKGLLRGKNSIVQLPTGVGKTKSIELIIRAMFLSERGRTALIVAPLRALCNEITDDMRKAFGEEVSINLFSDLLEIDFYEIINTDDEKRIFVCTPEKLQFIFHHQPEIMSEIDLYVFDEGHMFDDKSRGAMYELLIENISKHLTKRQQLVMLSAVLSNADKILEWAMGNDGILAYDIGIKSTPKVVGFTSTENEIHYFSDSFEEEDFYIPKALNKVKLQSKRVNAKPKFFPEDKSNDVALYYANLLCKNGGVAIYMSQRRYVRTILKRLVEVEERGYDFNKILESSNREEIKRLGKLIKEYYGEDSIYYKAANIGIFPHYSSLPNGVRISVEHAFRKGRIKAVTCTSTLAQGVNIPIKYLIMTSLRSAKDIMSTRNFQNLMGRTARSGVYTEGSILISDSRLFDSRNSGKGYYAWQETTELFDLNNTEACGSAILSIVQDFYIDYELSITGDSICNFIINHFNQEWPQLLKEALYDYLIEIGKDSQLNRQVISNRISEYKNIIGTIENEICYAVSCRNLDKISLDKVIQEEKNNILLNSLAFFLATNDEKKLLNKVFDILAEKIAENAHIIPKISKAMVDVNIAEKILDMVSNKELNTVEYNQNELLLFIIELFNFLYPDEAIDIEICKKWINGDSYKAMETDFDLPIFDIEKICGQTISFYLSFLIGNIIDYLDSESVNLDKLQLLQQQVKYGVNTETAISICEKIFNDRIISNLITYKLGDNRIDKEHILKYVKYHYDMINKLLEQYPSYFNERITFLLKV